MNHRIEQYKEASRLYVQREKQQEDVIGIIVSGSMLYAQLDKNSDIDIHLILSPDCDYRERGNTWINGVEIEYFKNPPAQIRSYFKKEQKSPHTAHMLAFGELVYGDSEVIHELIGEAKAMIGAKPLKLRGFEIELEKYFLDDMYKDLEDALTHENFMGANLIRAKMINRCIDIFCKIYQIRRGKDKRLNQQIESIDPAFLKGIELAMGERGNGIALITQLREDTEKLLGGRRTQEWKLRSGLDL